MQNNSPLGSMNEQEEKLKTAKDISEIEQLLITYQQTGYLDKDKAVKKICEARAKEIAVEVALMPKNPSTTVFYENASASQLASALSFILQYLSGKAMVKGIENQNGAPHC